MQEANIKLTFGQKCLFSIGDFGNNFSWTFVSNFLLYFWTDVLGIGAGIAGIIMGLSRVWDAINDPIIGRMADHTDTKWGRYRPWIIRMTIPLAILNILCFTDFGFASSTTTIVVAAVSFFVLVAVYTSVNVPYSAMEASLTLDSDERGQIATYRLFFAYCAAIFISYLTQRFVASFGNGNNSRGYLLVAIMYSVIMVICHVVCFKGTKEVVKAPVEKMPMKECFASLKGNWPVIALSMGFLVYGVFGYGRSAVALYYFQYVGGDALAYATYALAYMLCCMAGIVVMPSFAGRFKNKRTVVQLGFGLLGVTAILCFLVDPVTNITMVYILSGIGGLGCGMGTAMIYGMVPDTTEYTQEKYGIRAAGFISAFVNFWLKVGMAIGTSGAGIVLSLSGYVANVEQSAGTQLAIRVMFTIVPGTIAILTALVLFTYKLDRDTYNEILRKLDAQNG